MCGGHLIQHWSRTQQLVALSSAEAELNAAVKAGQEGIGIGNLLTEMGDTKFVQLYGDSSANHGIITRQGTGKVKHLSVRQLWLQERTSRGGMSHKKVPRLYNWSDILTHHFTKSEAEHHFPKLLHHKAGVATTAHDEVSGKRSVRIQGCTRLETCLEAPGRPQFVEGSRSRDGLHGGRGDQGSIGAPLEHHLPRVDIHHADRRAKRAHRAIFKYLPEVLL